jgi:hypothetical protein
MSESLFTSELNSDRSALADYGNLYTVCITLSTFQFSLFTFLSGTCTLPPFPFLLHYTHDY